MVHPPLPGSILLTSLLGNPLGELWSLLHFLMPQVFTPTTVSSFKNAFSLSDGLYDQKFLLASQKLLELIMLRRTKESVKTELSVPPREELTRQSFPSSPSLERSLKLVPTGRSLRSSLPPLQRWWYKRLLTRIDSQTLEEIFTSADDADADTRANVKHAMESGQNSWKQMNAQCVFSLRFDSGMHC